MVAIEITSRSKSLKAVNIPQFELNSPVSDIVSTVASSNKTSIHRIRLTAKDANGKQVPLNTDKSLLENGYTSKDTTIALSVKDLGPQLGWRTVYIIEYLGPLLIHPIFFYGLGSYYNIEYTQTQTFAFYFAVLHFLKRELETIFIHRFSNATMPAFNIFKNSGHYWILSGFNLAIFIYHTPSITSDSAVKNFLFKVNDLSPTYNYLLALLWAFAELSNLKTHLTLSSLRSGNDTKKYSIPYGYGFTWCSFPNYFFESVAWVAYALLVGNWSAWLFLVIGSGQMYIWAVKKHKRYLKTFGDEYKKLKRTAFIPFLA